MGSGKFRDHRHIFNSIRKSIIQSRNGSMVTLTKTEIGSELQVADPHAPAVA